MKSLVSPLRCLYSSNLLNTKKGSSRMKAVLPLKPTASISTRSFCKAAKLFFNKPDIASPSVLYFSRKRSDDLVRFRLSEHRMILGFTIATPIRPSARVCACRNVSATVPKRPSLKSVAFHSRLCAVSESRFHRE